MTKPDTITGDQRSVLAKLAPLLQEGFYLVSGVAIAAHAVGDHARAGGGHPSPRVRTTD